MNKLRNFIQSKYYIPFTALIALVIWVCGFLSTDKLLIEGIGIILIALIGFLVFILSDDTFPVIPLVCYSPFIYSRSFDSLTTPITLYIALGIILLGAIIFLFKNKVRLKNGRLLYGLIGLGVTITLGGILTNRDYLASQLAFSLFASLAFIFVYLFFISTNKANCFKKLSLIMVYLILLIMGQSICFYLQSDNLLTTLSNKSLHLGWGVTNNIATMYLLAYPFIFGLINTESRKTSILLIIELVFLFIFMLLTFSRGGIFAFFITIIFVYAYTMKRNYKNKQVFYSLIAAFVFLLTFGIIILLSKNSFFTSIRENILNFSLDSLNGRKSIYERILASFKDNWFFGKGLYDGYYNQIDVGHGVYQWAHGTIWQTLHSFGILGIIALMYHMFQKYFYLVKNITHEKVIILFSFVASGIYGLFDISYYYIVYMVVLLMIFCSTEEIYRQLKKIDDKKKEE